MCLKAHFSMRSVVGVLARPVFGLDLCMYVVLSTIIQIVSRGFTSHEVASRSPFAIKFANPSDTISACVPPFSLEGFPTFVGYAPSYCCIRNFDIVKLNFLPFCLEELLRIYLQLFR